MSVRAADVLLEPDALVPVDEEGDLQVDVRALPVDAAASVPERAEPGALRHRVALGDRRVGQVGVEAVHRAVAPVVLHDHVVPICRRTGVDVRHHAPVDGHHRVDGLAERVALGGRDVDALVDAPERAPPEGRRHGVADEPVLSPLPLLLAHAVDGHVQPLVEALGRVLEEGTVGCREDQRQAVGVGGPGVRSIRRAGG